MEWCIISGGWRVFCETLTAATLPEAEIALTARVDCLRALRNILLGEVCLILCKEKRINCK